MTPARSASCNRLLRGIVVLESRHKEFLAGLAARRNALQSDLARLAELIGMKNYADPRLLLPMSRRVGTTSKALHQVQQDIVEAYRKETKLSRARQLLLERIEKHEMEVDEEELGELVSEMISSKLCVQSSTRKWP